MLKFLSRPRLEFGVKTKNLQTIVDLSRPLCYIAYKTGGVKMEASVTPINELGILNHPGQQLTETLGSLFTQTILSRKDIISRVDKLAESGSITGEQALRVYSDIYKQDSKMLVIALAAVGIIGIGYMYAQHHVKHETEGT